MFTEPSFRFGPRANHAFSVCPAARYAKVIGVLLRARRHEERKQVELLLNPSSPVLRTAVATVLILLSMMPSKMAVCASVNSYHRISRQLGQHASAHSSKVADLPASTKSHQASDSGFFGFLGKWARVVWRNLVDGGLRWGNVAAGVAAWVVAIVVTGVPAFLYYRLIFRRKFRRFFGKAVLQSNGEARIVLDTYLLDRDGIDAAATRSGDEALAELARRPYLKPFCRGDLWRFPGAGGYVIGYCTARGLAYLLKLITGVRRSPIDVKSDEEAWSTWGGTVISIGGPAASMHSDKILGEYGGFYLGRYQGRDPHGVYRKSDGAVITDKGGKCYGLIAKYTPGDDPDHRLIVCAGVDEWGTSGACWYLSRHWQTLYRKCKNRDFVVVLEVDSESDSSARLVDFDRVLELQHEMEEAAETRKWTQVTILPRAINVTGDIMPASGSVVTPEPHVRRGDRAQRRRKGK